MPVASIPLSTGIAGVVVAATGWALRRRSHWWMLIASFGAGAAGLAALFVGRWILSLPLLAFYFFAIHRWVGLADDQP